MNRDAAYISDIPAHAEERLMDAPGFAWPSKRLAYYVGEELVGLRQFDANGQIEMETAYRNGKQHGRQYGWYDNGSLHSLEPYESGKQHGTAYQWAQDGTLLGSYTMERGSGIDLWHENWSEAGTVAVSEVYYYQDGERHGFEWWLNHDQKSVWKERHWQYSKLHGIERDWNAHDRLHRGFPRYWIQDERVTKRQYVRAAAKDPTLPPFRSEDNLPPRTFPAEIAQYLGIRPLHSDVAGTPDAS